MTLDTLPLNVRARITAVNWTRLAPEEVKRLQALGIDAGAEVEVDHRGVFGGRDPIAIAIGRMTVALRRRVAGAIHVDPLTS